jgi:hypothetical protein
LTYSEVHATAIPGDPTRNGFAVTAFPAGAAAGVALRLKLRADNLGGLNTTPCLMVHCVSFLPQLLGMQLEHQQPHSRLRFYLIQATVAALLPATRCKWTMALVEASTPWLVERKCLPMPVLHCSIRQWNCSYTAPCSKTRP